MSEVIGIVSRIKAKLASNAEIAFVELALGRGASWRDASNSMKTIKMQAVEDHLTGLGFWIYPQAPFMLVKQVEPSTEPVVAVWKQGDVVFQFFTASNLYSQTDWPEHRAAARAYFEEHSE